MKQFFGKYRGKVIDNVDPKQMGCMRVSVPAVLGTGTQSWAYPSVPYAGLQTGFYAIPPVGANVWVEFEGGDPDHPIWTGCFWGPGEAPAIGLASPPTIAHIAMQTTLNNSLLISDAPGAAGGILLQTNTGAMISINQTGILISNGQGATILMNGPTVNINQGALAIT
jgi:uncharacterized protein involved in type VI secretion and phage assembly